MNNPLKQYNLTNYKVFEYHFDSLYQFTSYIQSQPINKNVFDRLSSERGGYDFTKTNSFNEAINLCMYGCDEEFSKFFKIKNEVSKTLIKPLEKPIIYKDIVGYAPSVADFVIGSPFNMWNKGTHYFNNIIDIYFQLNYRGDLSTSEIYNRGAITLSLIESLEKFGYAVNLIPFALSTEYHEVFIVYFDLKKSSEFLNEKLLFFPLCHPSFSRRLLFRLKEVTPFSYTGWENSYGKAASEISTIKHYIKLKENSILISAPDILGINGDNIYSDLESMLKAINFDKYVTRV